MSIAGRTLKSMADEVLSFQFSSNYESLVKQWLSEAQRKAVLQSEFRVQEQSKTFATTNGDNTLELPEDFARWINFYDEEVRLPLTTLELREYDLLEAASGRPTAYTVFSNQITLYPIPDASYSLSLRYWRLPQDLSSDGDEPEIPVQYHDLLIYYAMWKAYLRENDYQAAASWKAEWEAGVMKMRGEVSYDTHSGPELVGGTWGDVESVGPQLVWP